MQKFSEFRDNLFYHTHLNEGASNRREQKKPQIIIITIEARHP